MKLASHNTFTFLTPRTWWMRLLAFTARCQRVNFDKQLDCGAQMFDLRVRFKDDPSWHTGSRTGSRPIVCHGLIEYESWPKVVDALQRLNDKGRESDIPFYLRVILEKRKPTEQDKERFRDLCQVLKHYHHNIIFFGGNDRSDWSCQHPVYDFGTSMPDIDEEHASTTALFPRFPRLDDLWPWLYAKLFNHRNIQAGTTHEWLMIDFVDIQ